MTEHDTTYMIQRAPPALERRPGGGMRHTGGALCVMSAPYAKKYIRDAYA